MIGLKQELAAWDNLKEVIEGALSRYPTSLEEDKQILEKDDQEKSLSRNIRNCVIYRKNEKIIL